MESSNRPKSSNGGAGSRPRPPREATGASGKRGSAGAEPRKGRRGRGSASAGSTASPPKANRARAEVAPAPTNVPAERPTGANATIASAVASRATAYAVAPVSEPPDAVGSGTAGEQEASGGVVGIEDFEAIFERFQTPLVNFIFRLVGNREQALDLSQDVFVKVHRALSSGTTIQAGALSSWLYRIASNTATDALRRRRLISWLPLSLFNDDRGIGAGVVGEPTRDQGSLGEETITAAAAGSFGPDYDGAVFDQRVADSDLVATVLRRLPTKYAECLLLYEHEGYSCAEIAEILHVSASAVKMRLMRARERFIELYQKETAGQ